MKKLRNNIRVILGGLEAPVIFSILLVFVQVILEMLEVRGILFLDRNELVFIISYLILFIYFFPIYIKSTNKNNSDIKIYKLKVYKILILGSLLAIIFNIIIHYILSVILKQNVIATTDGMRFNVVYLFIVCIAGPFIEELCYRGMVLRRLEEFYKRNSIVVISSIIFALGHASSYGNILYAFVLGIFMMLIFIKNKSIIFPVIFHISANVTSVFMSLFSNPSISNMYIYLPLLVFSIFVCVFILVRNKELFI